MTRCESEKRRSGRWPWACLAFVVVASQGLGADVVHLKNGRSMEGIVIEETQEEVLIKLAFGEIGLPRASVERIERGESALAEYLERRAELVAGNARAAEWLQLAAWAESEGLDHSSREAALRAARLDPELPALAPWMERFGYAYSVEESIWLPYDELMRRRGFVRSGDRWLTPEEALAERQAREETERRRQEVQRQDRLARAMEMMALAQMAQAEEERRRLEETPIYPVGIPIYGGYPILVPPHSKPGHRPRPDGGRPGQYPQGRFLERPPGSLIPAQPPAETNRGSMQKAPASDPP